MARHSRFIAKDQLNLIQQTVVAGGSLFAQIDDFVYFLELLKISAKVNKVAIFAHALLPESFVILAMPSSEGDLGRFMQWLGRRYVPYFNKRYGRRGTLWAGRFRACPVQPSEFLKVCRFVEEQPVLAGLAGTAGEYPWSSAPAHLGLHQGGLIAQHPAFWALGNTPFEREAAYARLCSQALDKQTVHGIENSLTSGWAIGDGQFVDTLQKLAHRPLRPGKRGRPPGSTVKQTSTTSDPDVSPFK